MTPRLAFLNKRFEIVYDAWICDPSTGKLTVLEQTMRELRTELDKALDGMVVLQPARGEL